MGLLLSSSLLLLLYRFCGLLLPSSLLLFLALS